jgi:glutamate/aspartate transport system substrate-binding protein
MLALAAGRVRGLRVVTASSYDEALAIVDAGAADALAADDILIAGLLTEGNRRERYRMVGEALTHEPYGIAFARDDAALAEVVQHAFVRLAVTRELRGIYNKWFLRTLPSGSRLGLPMSPGLERSFQVLGLPPE